MVMHARSGGSIEIMGLMQGKVEGDTFIVTDAFRLPVEGTETRVMAVDDANTYMVEYLSMCRESKLMENAVGWYHSHPGYGCWLSGIDVDTESTHQQFNDPFLAVVIDPDRTISAGKVEIGAFRTYPKDHKPKDMHVGDDLQAIPEYKTEDFGAHANRYYSLEVSHYKSTLDTQLLEQLWQKYWVSTLSQSPLFTNREYSTRQMLDLGQKLRIAEKQVKNSNPRGISRVDAKDSHLEKVVRVSDKLAGEEERGLLADDIKTKLFNHHTSVGGS